MCVTADIDPLLEIFFSGLRERARTELALMLLDDESGAPRLAERDADAKEGAADAPRDPIPKWLRFDSAPWSTLVAPSTLVLAPFMFPLIKSANPLPRPVCTPSWIDIPGKATFPVHRPLESLSPDS